MLTVKNLAGWAFACLSSLLPKQRRVVITSEDGFTGNARAFYEAIAADGFPFGDVLWIAQYPKHEPALKARSIRTVPVGSLRAFWEIVRARWLVSTHGELGRKKALWGDQEFVNLWHGSGMKASGHLLNQADGDLFAQTLGRADITLTTSELMRVVWSSFCKMSALKVFATGYPRNDVFHAPERARANLIELVDGSDYDHLIIYAPTHRRVVSAKRFDKPETQWTFQDFVDTYVQPELIEALERHNTLLVVKLHPMGEAVFTHIADRLPDNIRLLTNAELSERGVEFYDVLAGFDMMWTDYSSMSTDYLLTGKPVLIFTDDLEEYRKGRGVIFDDFDLFTPGPKVNHLGALSEEFPRLLLDPTYYADERKRFQRNFHTAPVPYSRNVLELMRTAPEDRAQRLEELKAEATPHEPE